MKKIAFIAAMVLGTCAASAQNASDTVKTTPVTTAPTPKPVIFKEVKAVDRSRKAVTATYSDTTVTYGRTKTSQVPYADKLAQVMGGERNSYNSAFEDVEGRLRHHVYISVGGLALCNISNKNIVGGPDLRLGFAWGRALLEAEGFVLFNNEYPLNATEGNYMAPGAYLNAGLKFWESERYRHFWALKVGAGYNYQRTDVEQALTRSRNYGFGFKGALQGSWNIKGKTSAFVELTGGALPQAVHMGGGQELRWFVGIGAGITFGGPSRR